jgi:oligoribonuclease NrnB/cAMP/cGMP phosphodiesterase (DHH superfamily)
MNVKLITHTDLDGAGCAIIAKSIFNDLDIEYHNYDTIDEVSKKMLNDTKFDKIIFADITPEEDIGKQMLNNNKFLLIDHHKTREYLVGDFSNVIFNKDYCATVLFLIYKYNITCYSSDEIDYIMYSKYYNQNEIDFLNLVNSIDAWDTWKLESEFRERGEKLNKLFCFYGINKFIDKFKSPRNITDNENIIIQVINDIDNKWIDAQLIKENIRKDRSENNFLFLLISESKPIGLIVNNKKYDELGIDYVLAYNVNNDTVNLRSKGDFDVSEIAKKFGGGGHRNAAGFISSNFYVQ